jgi:hypothetical protein
MMTFVLNEHDLASVLVSHVHVTWDYVITTTCILLVVLHQLLFISPPSFPTPQASPSPRNVILPAYQRSSFPARSTAIESAGAQVSLEKRFRGFTLSDWIVGKNARYALIAR